jgi:CIC family chloride channel protein
MSDFAFGQNYHNQSLSRIWLFHLSLTSDQDMLAVIEVASGFVGETIPVIEQPSGKMIEVVSEANLFSEFFDIQEHVQDVENKILVDCEGSA